MIIVSEWLVAGELEPGLAFKAYGALINGSVGSFNAIVNTLVSTVPLLLGGLSVGLAFKAGLFNIGAQGQFLMGALGAVIVGVQLRESPPIIAVPVSLAAGMLVGAFWGFIPGFLKATRGAHEVVTTIMLNFIAIAFLAYMVSGPLDVPGSPSPITLNVGNAALPIIIGRNGHLGHHHRADHGDPLRVPPVPDDARLRDPRRRREPGCRALCRDVAQAADHLDDVAWRGCWPGWPVRLELLGTTHHMTASYGTTVGFDAIAVALLGRTSPIGIVLAALLFGAMRSGAAAMQIQAGVPAELVGVLQATILFFLVASPVIKRVFRLKGADTGLDEAATMTSTYSGQAKIA